MRTTPSSSTRELDRAAPAGGRRDVDSLGKTPEKLPLATVHNHPKPEKSKGLLSNLRKLVSPRREPESNPTSEAKRMAAQWTAFTKTPQAKALEKKGALGKAFEEFIRSRTLPTRRELPSAMKAVPPGPEVKGSHEEFVKVMADCFPFMDASGDKTSRAAPPEARPSVSNERSEAAVAQGPLPGETQAVPSGESSALATEAADFRTLADVFNEAAGNGKLSKDLLQRLPQSLRELANAALPLTLGAKDRPDWLKKNQSRLGDFHSLNGASAVAFQAITSRFVTPLEGFRDNRPPEGNPTKCKASLGEIPKYWCSSLDQIDKAIGLLTRSIQAHPGSHKAEKFLQELKALRWQWTDPNGAIQGLVRAAAQALGQVYADELRAEGKAAELLHTSPQRIKADLAAASWVGDAKAMRTELKSFVDSAYISAVRQAATRRTDCNADSKANTVRLNGRVYGQPRMLAKSGYGEIYLYTDPATQKQVIVKKPIFGDSGPGARVSDEERARKFAEAHRELVGHHAGEGKGHAHVVHLEGAVVTPEGDLYVVQSYAPHGNGHELLQKVTRAMRDGWISEAQAHKVRALFVRDAHEAVAHVHGQNVLHRDIKPGNFVIDDKGKVQLCDFGTAAALDDDGRPASGPEIRIDNPNWAAPELLTRTSAGNPSPGLPADSWSLGALAYEAFSEEGRPPFESKTGFSTDTRKNIDEYVRSRNHMAALKLNGGNTTDEQSLVRALMRVDPNERWSPKAALEHSPLFREIAGRANEEATRELILALTATRDTESQVRIAAAAV